MSDHLSSSERVKGLVLLNAKYMFRIQIAVSLNFNYNSPPRIFFKNSTNT